jgi:DNA-binding protein HU-beta
MNKTQLVDALAERLGDRRIAAAAVEGLLATIVEKVTSGETVTLTGFGVFEGRARAARTARNPRTGAVVAVPATTVPAFRPGAGFRAAVGAAAQVNGFASAPVAAEPAVEVPAKRVKSGGKAGNGKAKDAKAASGKAASAKVKDSAKDERAKDDKAKDDKAKGAKSKKAKSKK